MPVTISDSTTDAALRATTMPQDLFGLDGCLLGRFLPAVAGIRFPELGVTDEEMDRRLAAPDDEWVSGDEVIARLRSLRERGDV